MSIFNRTVRLFVQSRFYSALVNGNATNNYGDTRMPDKLYKTIELEMKGAEPAVLRSYQKFILVAADHLNIEVGKTWTEKPNKHRWTLLKSVHIYRKHLVQYEVRTHFMWMHLHKLTGSTADTFLEYVERMLPEGVDLKVTRFSLEPLPSHLNANIINNICAKNGKKDDVEN